MGRTMSRYTDQDRQNALHLYTEHGTAETSRQTGIPERTIVRWANQAGLVSHADRKKTQAAREARRSRIRDLLLEKTETLLESMDSSNAGKLAVPIGILIDKYRLEMGEATSRSESLSDDAIDTEIRRLVTELNGHQETQPALSG